MARRIAQTASNFFRNPLVQGKYPVLPTPEIPSHIVRPDYALNKKPVFREYSRSAKPHTSQAIEKLRVAARVAAKVLEDTKNYITERARSRRPLTEEDIDRFVFKDIVNQGAYPTPIGFMNFPKSVCVSVNECLAHGIPSLRPLEFGDKINIDVTVYIDGYHGDTSLTMFYGHPEQQIKLEVAQVAQKAIYEAISIVRPGVPLNLIGRTIEDVAESHNMHVCEEFAGHGIGHLLHMSPMVYHKFHKQNKEIIQEGQVFTIEPVITLFPISKLQTWKDNFTAISQNNPNAQFQHTLLVVKDGCEVLTKRPSEKIPNPNKNICNA